MNTNAKKLVKACLGIIISLSAGSLVANAQSVQEGSVWAPDKVKIDAKLDDWGNALQANNKTTDIYYTIANDDKNLYLAIKSSDQANNSKIVGGGINFTINTDGKKKDKDAFVVIFPVVNRTNMRNQFRQRGGGGEPMDSAAIADMRSQLLSTVKEITLKGFKDIPDSVISIYNEYGIKAAVGYDKNGSFIYELALPLKHLGLSLDNVKEIAYNIKINGIQSNRDRDRGERNSGGSDDGGGGGGERSSGGGGFGGGRGGRGGGGGRSFGGGRSSGFDFRSMLTPTDFWGKYTLAKKQ